MQRELLIECSESCLASAYEEQGGGQAQSENAHHLQTKFELFDSLASL